MLLFARWVLLLAAVHTWSGAAITAAILAGLAAEYARKHWLPQVGGPWAP